MLDVFGFPTPQGANYQEFYGGGTVRDWVKPRGASMVRMLLIGAGTAGADTGGGGSSGAVTQWIGPAIFIPDILRVSIGAGGILNGAAGGNTTIIYQGKDGTGYTLLTARGGTAAGTGGAAPATANNFFGASGIYKSIAGQDGAVSAAITASSTTFLSGGAGRPGTVATTGFNVAANYGYTTVIGGTTGGATGGAGGNGYFITQPIMIGTGGASGGGGTTTGGNGGSGGIGCGGGAGAPGGSVNGIGGRGGDGAVFIWSW